MDKHVQADKPEVTTETVSPAQAAEAEKKIVDAPAAPVSAAHASAAPVVEAKSEAAPPAPVIAAAPPAPVMPPPAPPAPTIEVKKAEEPKPAPAAVAAEATKVDPKPAAAEEKKVEQKQRVAFVIEDDFDASEIFGKAMEANGLAFEVINTGNEAIDRLNQVAPDIVVLDMHLPNVDGTQILAHIRKTERLAKTLVIVVTADARVGDMVKSQADLVVLKPATYTQVRDFASRLLRRHAVS